MINTLLAHSIRKDILRQNKKHNHKEYLRALKIQPKIRYWAGYHKKKLIFFGLVALISWNYDLHTSAFHSLASLRSPRQVISHLLLGSQKLQKTINDQRIVGWSFGDRSLNLLSQIYYETDKRLIFGIGRHYMFEVYSNMGLLQKNQDINTFWNASGFVKRRNQLISGVGYKQFITLYGEGFKSLKKINPQITQQEYLSMFLDRFMQKASQIQKWQKQFNKIRYQEYLKSLLADNQKKTQQISTLMKQNLQISEDQVEKKLQELGMKGMGIRDKWLYWTNRYVLFSLREYNIHKKLNLGIIDGRERNQLQKKLTNIQTELQAISQTKQLLKQKYKKFYDQELI